MGRTKRNRINRKSVSRPVKVDSNTEFIHLCKWMTENGWCAVTKLCPAVFPNTGRGLMATIAISANELIVKIPMNLLVTRNRALQEIPRLQELHLTTAEILTLYLLFSKMNNINLIYLSTLPQEFSVGALCNDKEIAMLPTSLQIDVICSRDYLQKKFLRIQNVWKEILNLELCFDFFKWAWFCVNTRAVFYKDCEDSVNASGSSHLPEYNMALAPYLDMLNHNTKAAIEANFNPRTQCYEIRTLQKIPKFSEVFINYGPHDNLKLFLEYGFIIPGNIHSVIKFELEHLTKFTFMKKTSPKKKQFLRQLSKNQKLFCCQEGFSWDAQIVLAILCTEEVDISKVSFAYEINPNHPEAKRLGTKIIQNAVQEMEEKLKECYQIVDEITPSFSVAKLLIGDMLNVLYSAMSINKNTFNLD